MKGTELDEVGGREKMNRESERAWREIEREGGRSDERQWGRGRRETKGEGGGEQI